MDKRRKQTGVDNKLIIKLTREIIKKNRRAWEELAKR